MQILGTAAASPALTGLSLGMCQGKGLDRVGFSWFLFSPSCTHCLWSVPHHPGTHISLVPSLTHLGFFPSVCMCGSASWVSHEERRDVLGLCAN